MKDLNDTVLHFRVQVPSNKMGKGHKILARGGITAYYVLLDSTGHYLPDQPENEPAVAGRMGFAVCSPLDAYSRQRGRIQAMGRARTNRKIYTYQETIQTPLPDFDELVRMAGSIGDQLYRKVLKSYILGLGLDELVKFEYDLVFPRKIPVKVTRTTGAAIQKQPNHA